ncbi:ribosome biogenesis protein SLX9-domain-containing protein [Infundibulicybe gibba]|nr:ribosome biogenesis protein SLX9-domain-containing protein [Infundibulicybe gibba]
MPKESRRRTSGHASSVKLHQRQFAVQDNAVVEHVDIGGAIEASAADLLGSMSKPHESQPLKKKEKHQLRREAFLQRLEQTHSPYSKSHNRRLKRKAKEQLAGGVDDMQAAIIALDGEISPEIRNLGAQPEPVDSGTGVPRPKSQPKPGTIGEGKSATLSKSQRKRALRLEQARHPLILSNSAFSSNPFQTIRTHAQNTLLKHNATT